MNSDLIFAQYEISSRNPAGGGIEVGSGKETSRMETVLVSEAHRKKECESNKSLMQNLTSPGRRHEKSASFLEKESKTKQTIINSLLDKLESTSENDLRTSIGQNARGTRSKIVASESSHEVKNSSQQDEQMLPQDKMTSGNHSPRCRKKTMKAMKAMKVLKAATAPGYFQQAKRDAALSNS
ncbi:hypothetical protein QYF36_020257 [Acer negundo]|nr:hypothetical protein QYF36_020257 [Acer negundo]